MNLPFLNFYEQNVSLFYLQSEHQSPLAMLMTIYNVISRKIYLKMPTISHVYIKHHNLNSLNHFKLFPNHLINCVILFLQQWETTESGGRGRRKRWRWPSWRRTNWRRSSVWSWRRSAGLTERPSLLFASWENTPRWVATWHLTVKIMFLCRKKRICRERKIKAVLSVQCFISFRWKTAWILLHINIVATNGRWNITGILVKVAKMFHNFPHCSYFLNIVVWGELLP